MLAMNHLRSVEPLPCTQVVCVTKTCVEVGRSRHFEISRRNRLETRRNPCQVRLIMCMAAILPSQRISSDVSDHLEVPSKCLSRFCVTIIEIHQLRKLAESVTCLDHVNLLGGVSPRRDPFGTCRKLTRSSCFTRGERLPRG